MTALSDTLPQPSRRAWAMELMVVSSVGISFGGLVIRAIEAADVWQINFYRSIALVVMVAFIMVLRHGCDSFACTRGIGRPGLLGHSIWDGECTVHRRLETSCSRRADVVHAVGVCSRPGLGLAFHR